MPSRIQNARLNHQYFHTKFKQALATGVVTTLQNPAIPTKSPDLAYLQQFFQSVDALEGGAEEQKPNDPGHGLGTLFKLPPELRHIIYRHVLANGDATVLRVSKRINEEASEFLFKVGTCYMTIGIPKRPPPWKPDLSIRYARQELLQYIQHVSLRVRSRIGEIEPSLGDFEFLDLFSGSSIPRKSCTVSIMIHASTKRPIPSWILRKIRNMTGFEVVAIRLGMDWIWLDVCRIGNELRSELDRRMFWAAVFAKKWLTPSLGPGNVDFRRSPSFLDKKHEWGLQFRPQKYWEGKRRGT